LRKRRSAVIKSELSRLTCSVENGLARITLNQPERGNPIDGQFCREFRDIAIELSNRPDIRSVLIAAEGRYFSVGGDIMTLTRNRAALPGLVKSFTADLHTAISQFQRMDAPVVAAVQGAVAGGSVSIVALSDIVFASRKASFTAAFPMIGFSADSGSTISLSARMGFSRAKRFLLLSETLSADDALDAGLVDFLTEPDELTAAADSMALRFASGPTRAYGGIKRTMLSARTQGLETQLEDEAQALSSISTSDDSWEGLTAFEERREPRFKGN
jgi:2-(1,2-epoxy-1,2-dihydrophenyl)acetyl-CoA isomerase